MNRHSLAELSWVTLPALLLGYKGHVGGTQEGKGAAALLFALEEEDALDVGAGHAHCHSAPQRRGRPTGSPSAYLILDLDMSDSAKAPAAPAVQSILEVTA